jgi:hypothetical protein
MAKNSNSKAVQQRADAKRAGTRTRNWTCIVYPESAPEQWREVLDETHIEWVESPLHDRDVNADGEKKKPHWHVALLFESVKTLEQVRELTDRLNAPMPQKCNGLKGLVRYMAHMDNPEKVQYSVADIVGHGGADIAEILKPSVTEQGELVREMFDFVRENGIFDFNRLADYAKDHRADWFDALRINSTYFLKSYIQARHFEHKERQGATVVYISIETGEIIENYNPPAETGGRDTSEE